MSPRCISIYTRCTRCGENGGKKNLSGSGVGSFVRFVSWIGHSLSLCVSQLRRLLQPAKRNREGKGARLLVAAPIDG